ncbi:MAG TPA: ABC transporter permease subunit [Pyrinomonadaceae bacterium]|nr:ABC transporter permease subunit [Pyrinomonadaceae bacterium]
MLWYKAWLETRFRFLLGATIIVACCSFFVLGNPFILGTWREWQRLHPNEIELDWIVRATSDYPFFIWHFLFQIFLQQLWVLFAVLISFGGIARESAQGTAGFTLSLPVSRQRLVSVRAAVGLVEMVVLGLISAVLVPTLSIFIGKPYPLMQGISHALLMMIAGSLFFSLGLLLSTVIQSEHAPTLIGVTLVAFFYFVFQPYADGAQEPFWLKPFNLQKVMAGAPDLSSWTNFPLLGACFSLLAACGLFYLSLKITERLDY